MPIGTERSERLQPRFWCAVFVKLFFFCLCRDANLAFDGRIADHNKMPRLQIRAIWRRPGPCECNTRLPAAAPDDPKNRVSFDASASSRETSWPVQSAPRRSDYRCLVLE